MKPKPARRVSVHIQSLMLKGFRYEDRHAVARGVQEQLTRLLSEPGLAQRLGETGSLPHLHVGQVHTVVDAKPQQIGIAAANGIGKRLGQ